MPLVFPGFGWDNLMNKTPGTTKFGRRKGEVMWKEVKDAVALNVNAMYIAMFDEIDESTAIFKITDNIPVNHYYTDNEGLPSDFYLNLTGYASSIIAGERTLPSVMPDFSSMSQPSIPEIIFPQHLDTINRALPLSILWSPSVHKTDITEYQVKVDNQMINLGKTTTYSLSLTPGWHTISVRAKNGLGNYGGWSEVNEVYARDASTFLNERTLSDLSVYLFPNPAKTSLFLASQADISENTTIKMLSSEGKLLHQEKIFLNGLTEIKIPSTIRNHSFIYLQLQVGKKRLMKKILITNE
jgi:hypothetical protein